MNSNNNTKSNFGKWGWSMIIYCAISYYLAAALSTDALNWFPTAFQAYHGWGESFVNTCNSMAGIGGWIGVGAAIVFSIMTAKKGSRFMALFGNIITGILCLIMAFTNSQPVFYLMIICLTFVGGNIQLNVVPNNIMNVWFPKKKGLALGWASMGLPICTATIILIFNAIGNPRHAYIALGIACFVFAFVSIFWAKNTPEEVGCTPDNEPVDLEQAKALMVKQEAVAKEMTLKVIAKDKNTWLIGIGLGLLWMTTIGLVSNFVTKMVMTGIEQQLAIMMLTVAAVVGIVGSYIWGWLDQKFGTRNASIIYGVWYLGCPSAHDFPEWFHVNTWPCNLLCRFRYRRYRQSDSFHDWYLFRTFRLYPGKPSDRSDQYGCPFHSADHHRCHRCYKTEHRILGILHLVYPGNLHDLLHQAGSEESYIRIKHIPIYDRKPCEIHTVSFILQKNLYSFTEHPALNPDPGRYFYSQLIPGTLTAHRRSCLGLLHS